MLIFLTEYGKYTGSKKAQETEAEHKMKRLQQIWFTIVQNYSARTLSYQSDKLIAIAGAARQLQTLLGGDNYLAGMWRSNFFHGLAWMAGKSRQRIENCGTPSWLWAFTKSIVKFPANLEDVDSIWDFQSVEESLLDRPVKGTSITEARILDIQVELLDPKDCFGPVLGGVLVLNGPWCKIKIEANPDAGAFESRTEHKIIGYARWARKIFPGLDISRGEFTLAFTDDNLKPTYRTGKEGVLLFPILNGKSPHENDMLSGDATKFSLDEYFSPETMDFDAPWYIFELQHLFGPYFLLVRKVEDSEEEYKRVGLAEIIQLRGSEISVQLGSASKPRTIKII